MVFCAVLISIFSAAPAWAVGVEADPPAYDFFTVYIGDSATWTGTLTNTEGATITISDMWYDYNPSGAFSITSPISVPYPLPGGASTDYQITFTPPGFSFYNATLRFSTNWPLSDIVDVTFWGFGDYPQPCETDFNDDQDTDGSDLAAYIDDPQGVALIYLALDFGRQNCP